MWWRGPTVSELGSGSGTYSGMVGWVSDSRYAFAAACSFWKWISDMSQKCLKSHGLPTLGLRGEGTAPIAGAESGSSEASCSEGSGSLERARSCLKRNSSFMQLQSFYELPLDWSIPKGVPQHNSKQLGICQWLRIQICFRWTFELGRQ